jgi:hypothetical protein
MSNALFAFVLLVTTPFGINTVRAAIVSEKPPLASIRYVGKAEDMLLFDVALNFKTIGSFRIIDEYGNILFYEKVKSLTAVRRFKIPAEGIRELNFESNSKKEFQLKTFVVTNQLEEKFNVTEVQ